ncbi:hypothetical protein Avbf_12994 [Armadillidium vulgare]|nr:hypothetical protein Avbf_12994 [Armadillidium vulgare]
MEMKKFLICSLLVISMIMVMVESAPAPAPAPAPGPNPLPFPDPKWNWKFPGQRRIGAVNYGFYKYGKRGFQSKYRG